MQGSLGSTNCHLLKVNSGQRLCFIASPVVYLPSLAPPCAHQALPHSSSQNLPPALHPPPLGLSSHGGPSACHLPQQSACAPSLQSTKASVPEWVLQTIASCANDTTAGTAAFVPEATAQHNKPGCAPASHIHHVELLLTWTDRM